VSTRSLTARLSLLFALSTATVLFVLGTTLDHAVVRHFRDMDRHDLEGKLALVRRMVAATPGAAATEGLRARLQAALVGHPELVVEIRDRDGELLFARGELPVGASAPGITVPFAAPAHRWWESHGSGPPLRGLSAPLQAGEAGDQSGSVLIAKDIGHHGAFMNVFRRILAFSILAAAAAAALLGWAATRAGLRPLQRVTALAVNLNTERLDARLPQSGVPAEVQALVDAFNSMLTRLEDSFRRLSEFSADAAHELRTPIANLTLQTQVALGTTRGADAYREILYSSLEEYERLGRMINDMLYLAQADDGRLRPSAELVELGEQVRTLFDYFDAWAEEEGITLSLDGAASVCGDGLMLRRALSNLLSNAIRHTARGGQVRVRLRADANWTRVSVENPGPRLPAERVERLFDRFYRGEPERNSGASGSGLGLAIVKAIVTAHGGKVSVMSDARVTRFDIVLPAADRSRDANSRRPSRLTDAGG
jgi:two-component system heavy metal sensor histidine kinase CusS